MIRYLRLIRHQPLVRNSAAVFCALLAGAAGSFVARVLLARLAGPTQFGVYSLVLGWAVMLASIAELGFGPMVLRFVAEYEARRDYPHLRGVVLHATLVVGAAGLVGAIGVAWQSHRLSQDYAKAFLIGAPLVPLLGLLQLHKTMLMALKRPVAGVVIAQWLRYAIFVAAILVAGYGLGIQINSVSAVAAVVGVLAVVALTCYYLVTSSLPDGTYEVRPAYKTRDWFTVALPLFLVTMADRAFARSDVIIVGFFRQATEVGYYSAALALAATADLLMTAVTAVIAPDFARLYANGKVPELQHTVTKAARLMFATVLPFAVVLIIFGRPLLLLFGKSFSASRSALSLLALTYVVNGFTGPVGLLLSQTGGHSLFARVVVVTSALSLAIELWLVARYGITGAAAARLTGAVLRSVALSASALFKTGIMPTALGSMTNRLKVLHPAAEGPR